LPRDKYRSAAFFSSLGLAHPRTVSFSLPPGAGQAPEPNDASQSPRAPGLIVQPLPLPLPFVAKPRYGKMGRGVALIASEADWLAYAREYSSGKASAGEFLAQDYIAASHGRDIRFFFAAWPKGRPWVCVQRRGQGFLSNAHAGGSMSPYEPPAGLIAAAERAFAASGLSYGSVDFLFADEEGSDFFICELNGCPGFEELERSCGLDAATAIVRAAIGSGNAMQAPRAQTRLS
jgi:glutathione synthase/RimK-type ligase-like ATP-grasp enzyme